MLHNVPIDISHYEDSLLVNKQLLLLLEAKIKQLGQWQNPTIQLMTKMRESIEAQQEMVETIIRAKKVIDQV